MTGGPERSARTKTILGIDPGLAATGYGLVRFDGSRFIHEAHGLIATPPDDPVGQRLLAIHRAMREVLERYKPDAAGIETLYFAKNVHSALPVAQARGVVLLALAEAGVPFCEYTPQQIKQAVVGSGRAVEGPAAGGAAHHPGAGQRAETGALGGRPGGRRLPYQHVRGAAQAPAGPVMTYVQ